MYHSASNVPLSVYVHLPWCIKKCPYCDFNSHTLQDELAEEQYVDALVRDLEFEHARHARSGIASVFFGGGTPSLFCGASFERILSTIDALWGIENEAEITLEANPGAADAERFSGYIAAGVNRISIGVQSFDDMALKNLGRVHDRIQAFEAVAAAKEAGFVRINLDIMYALPNHDVDDCLADLRTAIACDVQHLSCYQLTIEPNTAFHHNPPKLPDEDTGFQMQEALERELQAAGYGQYEVSAYARDGYRCRHNENYWLYGDYIGVGAGAHGKTTTDASIIRRRKVRHPSDYMARAGVAECVSGENTVDEQNRIFEFMLNALRLRDGFERSTMLERTGLPYAKFASTIETARSRDLLSVTGTQIQTTELGRRFLNDLTALFLPEPTTG